MNCSVGFIFVCFGNFITSTDRLIQPTKRYNSSTSGLTMSVVQAVGFPSSLFWCVLFAFSVSFFYESTGQTSYTPSSYTVYPSVTWDQVCKPVYLCVFIGVIMCLCTVCMAVTALHESAFTVYFSLEIC